MKKTKNQLETENASLRAELDEARRLLASAQKLAAELLARQTTVPIPMPYPVPAPTIVPSPVFPYDPIVNPFAPVYPTVTVNANAAHAYNTTGAAPVFAASSFTVQ